MKGPCILHDDNQKIREAVLDADMIVFATPLYYYGMSAQLKIVTDRFCAYNSSITRKHMKAALLASHGTATPGHLTRWKVIIVHWSDIWICRTRAWYLEGAAGLLR